MRWLYQNGEQYSINGKEKKEIMERQTWKPIRENICTLESLNSSGSRLINDFSDWREECEPLIDLIRCSSESDLQLPLSYFEKHDWKRIIDNDEIDSLIRGESEKDVWENFRYEFFRSRINLETFRARQNLTPRRRFRILDRDHFACKLCGRSAANGAMLEIDHIVPVSKGGSNDDDNLWTLCIECNRGKGADLIV